MGLVALTRNPGANEALPPPPWEREWDRPWIAPFLRSLSLIPEVTDACKYARVGRTTVYDRRNRDAVFADAWDESQEMAGAFLLRTGHQWATTGVPVKSVRKVTRRKLAADGTVLEVTEETLESDSAERSAMLMKMFLLAYRPDRFRDERKVELTGAEGGPVQIENIEMLDRQIAKLAAELAENAGLEPVPVE
jgi:hypothetical protein